MPTSQRYGFFSSFLHCLPQGSCRDLQLACPIVHLCNANKIVLEFPSESILKIFISGTKNPKRDWDFHANLWCSTGYTPKFLVTMILKVHFHCLLSKTLLLEFRQSFLDVSGFLALLPHDLLLWHESLPLVASFQHWWITGVLQEPLYSSWALLFLSILLINCSILFSSL